MLYIYIYTYILCYSIAPLTFYRGQLDALMHAVPADLDVEVLTVANHKSKQ